MTTKHAPKTIGKIIDHLEWLREELLKIQNALEKMEGAGTAVAKKK